MTNHAVVERRPIGDIDLELIRIGRGRPILVLHGFSSFAPDAAFLAALAGAGEVIAPSHPGFGTSSRPTDIETVYDLVHCYLALLEAHDHVTLVGCSFGGWLAAEIGATSTRRIDRLVLVDAVGIKVNDRETADIFDVFNRHPQEVRRRSWHGAPPDYDAMEDDALMRLARDREALCRYGWHPYLHNPRLKRWLANINVPTLVLWGESDRIVTPAYGEAYARAIPGARFESIAAAGHHPELEQPAALAARITAFLEG